MPYNSLQNFIALLGKNGLLHRIEQHVSPELEMAEITDRLSKNHGKAVLFTNNGTVFPVLMNAFGSTQRMLLALGLKSYDEFEQRLNSLMAMATSPPRGLRGKITMLSKAREFGYSVPLRSKRSGRCFETQMTTPDLEKIPVLKCWPYDGGRFITLPMVHTKDPETGMVNVGMYRMQVFDKETTGMHWHRHKGGAAHYEKHKNTGSKMPVVVTLGGDPVYTYAATAPLPEMISEYAFAGFLRKKRVKLVRCKTCDIEIPEDVDFVLEGYIDPSEELRTEGPFGDHTGFYSLPDKYPVFHVTHIFHRKDAVYPATIVGVPPMEDAYMGEATERLFLPLIKKVIAPEIIDMHLPAEGGFHNLAVVSIRKSYPGQAIKIMNALWGAGQMMFVRNIIVVNEDVNVKSANEVANAVLRRCSFPENIHFMNGPLDVLDHANSSPCFGKKTGLDATGEEIRSGKNHNVEGISEIMGIQRLFVTDDLFLPVMYVDKTKGRSVKNIHEQIVMLGTDLPFVIYVDHICRHIDLSAVLWMFLANFDPDKDFYYLKAGSGFVCGFDGTMKTMSEDGLPSSRPNILVMDDEVIKKIDELWADMFSGVLCESPSLIYKKITLREGYLYEK